MCHFCTPLPKASRLVQLLGRQRGRTQAALTAGDCPPHRHLRRCNLILETLDLSLSLKLKEYEAQIRDLQLRLVGLQRRIIEQKIPVVVMFEGWDAAGKGGAIKRLTEFIDPRGCRVWSISAPTPAELAHHYLWRFWTKLPGHGELAIFDRSWYGRVLVERVEGFATEEQWRRAYREIVDFERTSPTKA